MKDELPDASLSTSETIQKCFFCFIDFSVFLMSVILVKFFFYFILFFGVKLKYQVTPFGVIIIIIHTKGILFQSKFCE